MVFGLFFLTNRIIFFFFFWFFITFRCYFWIFLFLFAIFFFFLFQTHRFTKFVSDIFTFAIFLLLFISFCISLHLIKLSSHYPYWVSLTNGGVFNAASHFHLFFKVFHLLTWTLGCIVSVVVATFWISLDWIGSSFSAAVVLQSALARVRIGSSIVLSATCRIMSWRYGAASASFCFVNVPLLSCNFTLLVRGLLFRTFLTASYRSVSFLPRVNIRWRSWEWICNSSPFNWTYRASAPHYVSLLCRVQFIVTWSPWRRWLHLITNIDNTGSVATFTDLHFVWLLF